MIYCPDCGTEIPSLESHCPLCNRNISDPFTIRTFILDNFRFFTIIGTTGTMISLIPAMGIRVLGATWVDKVHGLLPFMLSVIILFGAIFLSTCFFLVFGEVFRNRKGEGVKNRVILTSKYGLNFHEGDIQRLVVLFSLVPMWIGIILFFIALLPLIPNPTSWMFALILFFTCLPVIIYSIIGWHAGGKLSQFFQRKNPHSLVRKLIFSILITLLLIVIFQVVGMYVYNPYIISPDVRIEPDQMYFSPHLSSAKGLGLIITNVSLSNVLNTRRTWSADYGFFIRYVPSISEVIILGNPVQNDTGQDIYWTWSGTPTDTTRPVTINVTMYPLDNGTSLMNTSLQLDWYTPEIVYKKMVYQ